MIIRRGVNFLAERHDGICGIFFAEGAEERRDVPADHGKSEEKEFRFIIGSRREDCRAAAELLKKELGAKGGGKPEMVQGSVRALAEEIEKALSQSTFSCVRI